MKYLSMLGKRPKLGMQLVLTSTDGKMVNIVSIIIVKLYETAGYAVILKSSFYFTKFNEKFSMINLLLSLSTCVKFHFY